MCKQIAFSIFPGGPTGKEAKGMRCNFNPQVGKIAGEENGRLLQYSSLENSMEFFFLVGYSPWGCKELDTIDTTELSHAHTWHLKTNLLVN